METVVAALVDEGTSLAVTWKRKVAGVRYTYETVIIIIASNMLLKV